MTFFAGVRNDEFVELHRWEEDAESETIAIKKKESKHENSVIKSSSNLLYISINLPKSFLSSGALSPSESDSGTRVISGCLWADCGELILGASSSGLHKGTGGKTLLSFTFNLFRTPLLNSDSESLLDNAGLNFFSFLDTPPFSGVMHVSFFEIFKLVYWHGTSASTTLSPSVKAYRTWGASFNLPFLVPFKLPMSHKSASTSSPLPKRSLLERNTEMEMTACRLDTDWAGSRTEQEAGSRPMTFSPM